MDLPRVWNSLQSYTSLHDFGGHPARPPIPRKAQVTPPGFGDSSSPRDHPQGLGNPLGPLKSLHVPFFLERLTARTSQVVMESFRYTGSVFMEMLEGM